MGGLVRRGHGAVIPSPQSRECPEIYPGETELTTLVAGSVPRDSLRAQMFKRRRDITDWPVRQIAKQTVASFTTDPDEWEVRAAVVLRG